MEKTVDYRRTVPPQDLQTVPGPAAPRPRNDAPREAPAIDTHTFPKILTFIQRYSANSIEHLWCRRRSGGRRSLAKTACGLAIPRYSHGTRGDFPLRAGSRESRCGPALARPPFYPWLIRSMRTCRIRARPKTLRAPGTFDRQVSRQAGRKVRRTEEAVQREGREVSRVPRDRRQHPRWRPGVVILRVRNERNRTPAEEDVNKAGSAGGRVLPNRRPWAVCKGVRPMNRTSRGRSRAVVRAGTREGNVRPTTPLNRLLGFCGWCGTRCLGWIFSLLLNHGEHGGHGEWNRG